MNTFVGLSVKTLDNSLFSGDVMNDSLTLTCFEVGAAVVDLTTNGLLVGNERISGLGVKDVPIDLKGGTNSSSFK